MVEVSAARPEGSQAALGDTERPPSIAARLLADRKVVAAGSFLLILIVAALAAPLIAPRDPLDQNLMLATLPPAGFAGAEPGYVLGTDDLGRDVLSRLIFGTRVSLTVAFIAAGPSALLGSWLGLVPPCLGRATDSMTTGLVGVWTGFPPAVFSIL